MSGTQKQQQNSLQNQATAKSRKNEQKVERKVNPEQMLTATETLRSEDVLAAQRQVGNQVVQRALDKKGREQRVTDSQGNLNEDLTRQIQSKRGSGSPLPEAIQKDASRKLGRKFNDVRIHTDETADKLSRSVSARAFTIGKDIFFKGGVFSPTTSAGRETLIHELTHVVQQSGSKSPSGGKLKLGAPDTAMEKEATNMGRKHATQVSTTAPAAGSVQRVSDEEELLQGQPDANAAIQRVEDEELLQGQPDISAAIQRQGEEEEMQMQEDEEELQMQHDSSGGVIQRSLVGSIGEWFDKKRKQKASVIPDAPALPVNKPKKDAPGPVFGPKTETGSRKGARYADLGSARTAMGIGSDTQKANLDAIGEKRENTFKEQTSEYKSKDKNFDKVTSRNKLMHTISNPTSKPEDIAAAKEKLDMLHKRSKTDKFKSLFKKGASSKEYSAQAEKKREENIENKKKSLQSLAEKGDDNAFQELKALNAQKKPNSTKQKIGGFFKKIGAGIKKGAGSLASKAFGMVKGQVQDKVKEAKEHYTGKKEEEKKEEAKPAGVTVNLNNSGGGAGGGGGGGGGNMAETISDLFQENKRLKAELESYRNQKKEEVTA